MLVPSQERAADELVRAATQGLQPYPSTLLWGPRGSGKRFVARAAAKKLGLDFIEIPLEQPVSPLRSALFAGYDADDRAASALHREGSLVYLSGLENADPEIRQDLFLLLAERSFYDPEGERFPVAEDVWVVASLCTEVPDAGVTRDHWLARSAGRNVRVDVPSDPVELSEIALRICASVNRDAALCEDATPIVVGLANSADHLWAIKEVLERASLTTPAAREIDAALLTSAIGGRAAWLLAGRAYRGQTISQERLEAWLAQFPSHLRAAAVSLVESIARRYFVDERAYHQLVREVVRRSGIERRRRVSFLRWQEVGRSGPKIANDLKTQAAWRPAQDLDPGDVATWAELQGNHRYFVAVDDLVGTGGTMASLVASLGPLLESFPDATAVLAALMGFEEGVGRIYDEAAQFGERVRVIVPRVFDDRDRCFTPSSRLVFGQDSGAAMRAFCLEAGERLMGLNPADCLGHEGTGAALVFHDHVPNNTLPILWHDEKDWVPLFPRSEQVEDEREPTE